MNKRIYKLFAVTILLICILIVATSCGGKKVQKHWKDDFTTEQIGSWDQQNKQYPYMMNGGYYIHFQGVNYPVVFENGSIVQFENAPDELFFLEMYELFTDPKLKNKCATLGKYTEVRLFHTDTYHYGYVLKGKRPANGTILYIDETKVCNYVITYTDMNKKYRFDADDTLYLKYNNEYVEDVAWNRSTLIYSNEYGNFFDHLDTLREIFAYAREVGIPFDGIREHTGLAYPTSIINPYTNYYWEEDPSEPEGEIIIYATRPCSTYDVTINYGDSKYPNQYCLILSNQSAIDTFNRYVSSGSYYKNVVYDESGKAISCYSMSDGYTKQIFYSVAEFDAFLNQNMPINPETQKAISYFTPYQSLINLDCGIEDILYRLSSYDNGKLTLNGVWDDVKIVTLNSRYEDSELCVFKSEVAKLPSARLPGYDFVGWYTDESYSGQPVTHVSYSDSYTALYAKFEKVDFYTITFEPFEGKTFESFKYAYGDEVSLPTLSRAHHRFVGWCTDAELTTTPITKITANFYGSYQLYPCFEPLEYTITAVSGGSAEQIKVKYGESFTLTVPESSGVFIGYFDADGVQYTDMFGKSITPFTDGADILLYPRYKEA